MNKTIIASAVVGVLALSGVISVASASPVLQIRTTAGSEQEFSGDPGGSVYPWPGGPGPGAGLPSAGSGWPTTGPGFAPDPSAGGTLGAAGVDASYLWLSEPGKVTFQFMGGGNSTQNNHFFVNGIEMFTDHSDNPIKVSGNPPVYDPVIGVNQFTVSLPAGPINFQFVTGSGVVLDNTGVGNGNPTDVSGLPGYLLAEDPYLAPDVANQNLSCVGTDFNGNTCSTVFAGLSDLPRGGDHDYQDMGVRISAVPEPGSLALLSAGLLGFGALRRRRAV